MASPHLHPHVELEWTAPHSTTANPATPPHAHPAHAEGPHSPNALAAAVTLATLSDSRPPTSHGDREEEVVDDDDDSGGISLAHYQQYFEDTSSAQDMQHSHSVAVHIQSLIAQVTSSYAASSSSDTLALPIPQHMSTLHAPAPAAFMGHLSSSDPALEPPPILPEAHLSISDRGSFVPITSFFHHHLPQRPTVPGLDMVQVPPSISRDDLQGDRYDWQGIDWEVRNTTRSAVRAKRFQVESAKLPPSLKEVRRRIPPTPNTDNFLQFRRNNTTDRAFIPHFQLRNVLAASSRNDIYYAAGLKVFRTDAEGTPADVVVDLTRRVPPDGAITTIASHDNVLIAGAFEGEYAITDLSSTYGSPYTFGRTSEFATDTKSRIVNHMHLFSSRHTYQPQAVLCSNDQLLRVLDCATNKFTHSFLYPAAVNCSATSPNGRMRVVVGDFEETLITNAETGQPFETLNSHTDDAFACAWADDGIHLATAAQDSTIVVWDARSWSKPLAVMTSEVSVPRSLHFSPIGSGPRVLVAAEADDYINVINAQTWESKQVFDFFGPIGGATFTPDGQSLFVANGERRFGGIVELSRTGWAETTAKRRRGKRRGSAWDDDSEDDLMIDWAGEQEVDHCGRGGGVVAGYTERQRRHLDTSQLIV